MIGFTSFDFNGGNFFIYSLFCV